MEKRRSPLTTILRPVRARAAASTVVADPGALDGARRASSAAGLTVLVLLIGACTPGAPTSTAAGWEQPAWMAQARQQIEEYQNFMISCMAERGAVGVVSLGGPVVLGRTVVGEGDFNPHEWEVWAQAGQECDELATRPEVWVAPNDEAMYDRQLDVHACIVAQGVELEPPPTLEVWLEQQNPWNPYSQLFDAALPDGVSLNELLRVCPQIGSELRISVGPEELAAAGV